MLSAQALKTLEGIEALGRFVETPSPEHAQGVKNIEQEADELRRFLIEGLDTSFVTPMDREDILALGSPAVSGFIEAHPSRLTLAVVMPLVCLVAWASVVTVLGYAMRYLTFDHPRLAYANEAVLPIYILHQPVILLVGYLVIPLALPILAKYLIILSVALAITLGLYEFGVRRSNPLRRIFGLKPRPAAQPAAEQAALAAA